jgi:hypothetical protein
MGLGEVPCRQQRYEKVVAATIACTVTEKVMAAIKACP